MLLSPEERQYLLSLARESIARAIDNRPLPSVDEDDVPERLQRDGASFVTLKKYGQLRGCIGSLEARRPLMLDVQQNAVAAALRDPRFPPVDPEELDALAIEISVLSAPEPVDYEDADELLDKLRKGVDGVIIECGWRRATFLPQVWETLPEKREFVQRLCLKAGMTADAYADGELDVWTYQVLKIGES